MESLDNRFTSQVDFNAVYELHSQCLHPSPGLTHVFVVFGGVRGANLFSLLCGFFFIVPCLVPWFLDFSIRGFLTCISTHVSLYFQHVIHVSD